MVTESREWLTVNEFFAMHKGRVGRTHLYEMIQGGQIPSIRLGRKILVPANAFDELLAAKQTA